MAARYSVVIPTLNEEKFLPKLLSSLAVQTDRNFEVIVVDGSSKDKTVAVAKTYAKKLPKLTVLVSKKASLPLQRNLGAKEARGEWLIFVDADSIFLPYFIDRCTAFIETSHPELFTTWFRPDNEEPKDSVYTLFTNIFIESTLIFKRPMAPGPLTIVTRTAYDLVGGYDEEHAFHEDVDFGQRLFKAGISLEILHETLCVWSLRRFRKEGTLKVLNQYVVGLLPMVFMNKSFKTMPGYIMGGHLYTKKRRSRVTKTLKSYEKVVKRFAKELFE